MRDRVALFSPAEKSGEISIAVDEPIAPEKLEGAAFVEREIKRRIAAAIDEQTSVFEISSTLGEGRGRRSLGDEVLPGEEIAPGVVPDDVIIGVAGAEALVQAGEKTIIDHERFGEISACELEAMGKKIISVAAG